LDLNADKEVVKEELENFGNELRKRIQQEIFFWKGVGKLEAADAKMVFHPDVLEIKGLQPIPAEKVLRKNVQHTVLRGEQEVVSGSFYEEEKIIAKRKSLVVTIGWIVVVLAVAISIFYLYQNGLKATASGTEMKVEPTQPSPTHK
jgi:hypothetical protein